MDREDGEMSDDNAMVIDDVKKPITFVEEGRDREVIYRADKGAIVIEKLEKVDADKIEERAKRFGLNLNGNRVITQRQIDELYANCGIESGNERHFRFDAICLSGVEGLTTKEIFQYLEDYKPVSLEWIDDTSCNVVCQDHISTALALLVHSREIKDGNLNQLLAKKSDHHWREGMPHPKKDIILMRFATNGDKKVFKKKPHSKNIDQYYDQTMDSLSKNPWGDLCKSWGVYDHQEVFQRKTYIDDCGDFEVDDVETESTNAVIARIKNKDLARRLRNKRTISNVSDSSSDVEWKTKSKAPRMRMHADDEESKLKKKPVLKNHDTDSDGYSPLSIEIDNTKNNYFKREHTRLSDKFKKNNAYTAKGSIRSRLGKKMSPTESYSSDDSSVESDNHLTSRVHKINRASGGSNSVWSRLESKESKRSTSDLRHKLKSKKQIKPNDLRDRLGQAKQTNLRIEIDNNYAQDL